jgi:uncharacterized membrane protein YkoI
MKIRLLILLLAVFGPLASQAQSVTAPQIVLDQFAKDYPTAENVEWEKSGSAFEVEFNSDGDEMEVLYNAKAELIQSERTISNRELPDGVLDAFEAKYPNAAPKECSVIESGGLKHYEIEYLENGREIEVLMDESGKELSSDEDEDDDEE